MADATPGSDAPESLAPVSPLSYPVPVAGWLRRAFGRRGGLGLRLSQSLGAFAGPGESISPLHVFFEVTNAGAEEVEVARVYVSAKGEPRPVYEGPFGGDHTLPFTLASGESSRFHARAKALAGDLKRAGHNGRPRVILVVEDASGNRSEKVFRFRVDEYLRLKDE